MKNFIFSKSFLKKNIEDKINNNKFMFIIIFPAIKLKGNRAIRKFKRSFFLKLGLVNKCIFLKL